ncbi:MAG: lysine exporter LysO family protein [Spirochaetia bacterium]|nr:lysine exporter LysO family protein [Spirochaetia bacterium]
METIIYLLTLFAFLAAGMLSARIIIPRTWTSLVNRALSLCLYLLLFFMGVRTGLIEDITEKLSMIGELAFLFAAVTVAGSAFTVILLGFLVRTGEKEGPVPALAAGASAPEPVVPGPVPASAGILGHLKEPLRLLLCVVAGAVLALLTPLFSWFNDSITNTTLYVLLFLVGVQMIQSNTDMISVFKNPISILLPIGTVAGSLVASCLIPLVSEVSLFESLSIASGFGWYSLSGVLIAELGDPILGSVAFLSNLFRESIAFLMIPLLASYGKKHAAISVGGATSMDVTLPIIEKSCGAAFVPLSLAHGILLTLIVPFLVPLFYAWV